MSISDFEGFISNIYRLCSPGTRANDKAIQSYAATLSSEYLYMLKQDTLLEVLSCLETLSKPIQRRGNIHFLKTSLQQEIVRRYLITYPKKFMPLNEFLINNNFENDPLTINLDILAEAYKEDKTWFNQEMAFLGLLEALKTGKSFFNPSINNILSRFRISSYTENIVVVVDKISMNTEIGRLMEDAIVRRITTVGQWSTNRIFWDQVSRDFEDTARTAQDALIAQGILSERVELGFADPLPYNDVLLPGGRSAGLAIAHLLYSWKECNDNRVFPYIAIFGCLDRTGFVGRVENVNAKFQAAIDNGVRVIFMPQSNRTDLDKYVDGVTVLYYSDGHINEVLSNINEELKYVLNSQGIKSILDKYIESGYSSLINEDVMCDF